MVGKAGSRPRCETMGDPKSLSLVSERSTFLVTRVAYLISAGWLARVSHNSGWAIATQILQRSMGVHKMSP